MWVFDVVEICSARLSEDASKVCRYIIVEMDLFFLLLLLSCSVDHVEKFTGMLLHPLF